jgi:hypothetical protein
MAGSTNFKDRKLYRSQEVVVWRNILALIRI